MYMYMYMTYTTSLYLENSPERRRYFVAGVVRYTGGHGLYTLTWSVYAGHGDMVAGTNYLLPTGEPLVCVRARCARALIVS